MMEEMKIFGSEVEIRKELVDRKLSLAFGIDLGTTNSAISVIANNKNPEVIPLISGKNTMPSCVLWNGKDGGFVVGEEAYDRINEVDHCVYSIKRHMQDSKYHHTFRWDGEELTMTPAEISAEILKALVQQTEGFYGEIKDVVVTVPAYFNTTGREATIEACKLAGLNLLGLLVEPSSASLTYNLDGDTSKNIVIYDLGGGTFDISLIHLSSVEAGVTDYFSDLYDFGETEGKTGSTEAGNEKHYTVIDTEGDANLGGDDYDFEMWKIVASRLKNQGVRVEGLTESFKVGMIHRLEFYKKEGIGAACKLAVKTALDDGTQIDTFVTIYPADFVKALTPIYKKTARLLASLLEKYKDQYPVDDIVLVGGSTKSSILREMLKEDFLAYKINCNSEPDLSVAMGASISAKLLKFGDENVKIFDALSLAISIEENGKLVPIIPKATQLPAKKSKVYTTVVDNQTSIEVAIYQGNTSLIGDAAYLGNLEITGIKERPAGEVDVVVTTSIDLNGILRCSASVDGVTKKVELKLKSEVSQETSSEPESRENRRIHRWRLAANRLKDSNARERIIGMLNGYPDEVSSDEIRNAISIALDKEEWGKTAKTLTVLENRANLLRLIENYDGSEKEKIEDLIKVYQEEEI